MNNEAALVQLPTLGVGVSLSLAAQPDPVALVQKTHGPRFVEYAGLVDVSRVLPEVQRVRAAGASVLFHPSYINFCGSFANHGSWLDNTAQHIAAVGSPWFAQDCAYCFWGDAPGYSSQLGYFIPPILNDTSLQRAITRVQEVQARVPVPVAIEPPPMSFVVGSMPLFTFFGELSRATGCALLLDMGHLVSYEMASGGKSVLDVICDLPVERVIEVHIAGGKLKQAQAGPIYIDAHESSILDITWQMLDNLLPLLPNVKALCYECEGVDENTVMSTLSRLHRAVQARSGCAALKACASVAP